MAAARRRALIVAVVAVLGLAACGGQEDEGGRDDDVLVASFDFPESQILGELVAEQLRRTGLDVELASGLGSREVVIPAMQQGLVDVVVEYAGTALDFLQPGTAASHGSADDVHAALRRTLADRDVVALPYAAAEDANAFAMTAAEAEERGLERLSQLAGIDGELVIGGPPECPQRRYCLEGLRARYGLEFGAFREMPTRADTALALQTGEIDVGMIETTDPRLFDGQLVLLEDDLELQPRENVTPLVRASVLEQHGDRIEPALAAVTRALSTEELLRLNRDVQLAGVDRLTAVQAWLDEHAPMP